ncbi:MAG: EsaB/YukD family protein [Clostridia bacterium]|nr:EsaB/YukD family protein [Clostridia bacterium]
MESIIVETYLPGANKYYDFSIPSQIPLEHILGEMAKAVGTCTDNAMVDTEVPMLINERTGQILDLERTLVENQILDGDRLILI